MENSMWTIEEMKIKKKNIVNNFHLLIENQRLPNMLGQRLYKMLGQHLYNMLGQRLYNMLCQRLYNMLGQRFLDGQSADGFASPTQRCPNENCSLRPNYTCYLGYKCIQHRFCVSRLSSVNMEARSGLGLFEFWRTEETSLVTLSPLRSPVIESPSPC